VAGEFSVDDDPAAATLHRVTEVLPAGPARIEAARRVWLDTPDWNLFRAGLLLEQRTAGSERRLLLCDLDGTVLCQAPAPRRTVTNATLPEGPLRDKILPLLDIRALLPRLEAEGSTAQVAVLDEVEKTVARVTVDGPFLAVGASAPVSQVRVETLRGYDKEAKQVGAKLAALAGLKASAGGGSLIFAPVFGVLGFVVAWRKPGNRLGWLLLGAVGFLVLSGAAGAYAVAVYREHHAGLPLAWVAVLLQPGWAPAAASVK